VRGWDREFALLSASASERLLPGTGDQFYLEFGTARGAERPSAQRLRVTWMVDHLNRGVLVQVLLAAAGLSAADSLKRLLPYMNQPPLSEQTAMLRGLSTGSVNP